MNLNKTTLIFASIIIIATLIQSCSNESEGKEENTYCKELKEQGIIDNYEYPIVPGTPEWAEFESHVEMIEACQIPEDILTNMCTHGLIVTCLNYPLLSDILVFNIIQLGYD